MPVTFLRNLGRGFLHLVYPRVCLVCDALLGEIPGDFCDACRSGLLDDPHATCRRCASTLGPNLAPADDCARCRNESYGFERAFRLGPYEGLRRDVILKLKHGPYDGLASAVGDVWSARAAPILRDLALGAVVPVPLHWRRRWLRGHNQAELLAEPFAAELRVPLRRRWLRRVRPTVLQSSLSPTARRENVRGAFAARRDSRIRGARVLLIDDVLTTGATASEAAKALKKAGAAAVFVAVLGHGQA